MTACFEIFPSDRFCSWTIGEVHVFDVRVVPNAAIVWRLGPPIWLVAFTWWPVGAEVRRECRGNLSQKRENRLRTSELVVDKHL